MTEIVSRVADYSPTRRTRARRTHGRAGVDTHGAGSLKKCRSNSFDAAVVGADGLIPLGLGIYNARRRIEIFARLMRG